MEKIQELQKIKDEIYNKREEFIKNSDLYKKIAELEKKSEGKDYNYWKKQSLALGGQRLITLKKDKPLYNELSEYNKLTERIFEVSNEIVKAIELEAQSSFDKINATNATLDFEAKVDDREEKEKRIAEFKSIIGGELPRLENMGEIIDSVRILRDATFFLINLDKESYRFNEDRVSLGRIESKEKRLEIAEKYQKELQEKEQEISANLKENQEKLEGSRSGFNPALEDLVETNKKKLKKIRNILKGAEAFKNMPFKYMPNMGVSTQYKKFFIDDASYARNKGAILINEILTDDFELKNANKSDKNIVDLHLWFEKYNLKRGLDKFLSFNPYQRIINRRGIEMENYLSNQAENTEKVENNVIASQNVLFIVSNNGNNIGIVKDTNMEFLKEVCDNAIKAQASFNSFVFSNLGNGFFSEFSEKPDFEDAIKENNVNIVLTYYTGINRVFLSAKKDDLGKFNEHHTLNSDFDTSYLNSLYNIESTNEESKNGDVIASGTSERQADKVFRNIDTRSEIGRSDAGNQRMATNAENASDTADNRGGLGLGNGGGGLGGGLFSRNGGVSDSGSGGSGRNNNEGLSLSAGSQNGGLRQDSAEEIHNTEHTLSAQQTAIQEGNDKAFGLGKSLEELQGNLQQDIDSDEKGTETSSRESIEGVDRRGLANQSIQTRDNGVESKENSIPRFDESNIQTGIKNIGFAERIDSVLQSSSVKNAINGIIRGNAERFGVSSIQTNEAGYYIRNEKPNSSTSREFGGREPSLFDSVGHNAIGKPFGVETERESQNDSGKYSGNMSGLFDSGNGSRGGVSADIAINGHKQIEPSIIAEQNQTNTSSDSNKSESIVDFSEIPENIPSAEREFDSDSNKIENESEFYEEVATKESTSIGDNGYIVEEYAENAGIESGNSGVGISDENTTSNGVDGDRIQILGEESDNIQTEAQQVEVVRESSPAEQGYSNGTNENKILAGSGKTDTSLIGGDKHTDRIFRTFNEYQFLARLDGEEYRDTSKSDSNLGKNERISANLVAIRIVDKIFAENRLVATREEQENLAKFSGFGGLGDFFTNEKYASERQEIIDILGDDYYRQLRYSSLNAYYTPNNVVDAMYAGLKEYGVSTTDRVRALETSCGIGNFISRAPSNYDFVAVEKDILSATIAKLLHPKTRIYNKGFEEVSFNGEFDVVIGNPPYENERVNSDDSVANKELIHNYFVLKSQSLLKERGVSSFVITSGFLDSKTNRHRTEYLKDNFMLNAFRLPNEAFKSSHTSVATDIIFSLKINKDEENLRAFENQIEKRFLDEIKLNSAYMENSLVKDPRDFENIELGNYVEGDIIKINEYFAENDFLMLGDKKLASNQFGEKVINIKAREDFNSDLSKIVSRVIRSNYEDSTDKIYSNMPAYEPPVLNIGDLILDNEKSDYIEKLKVGNVFEVEGKFYTKEKDGACEEVFFVDEMTAKSKNDEDSSDSNDDSEMESEIESKSAVGAQRKEVGIISDIIYTKGYEIIGTNNKGNTIYYKQPLSDYEKETLRMLINYRDLINDNLAKEREYGNSDEENKIIENQKAELRMLRTRILNYTGAKYLNSRQKRTREKGVAYSFITKHTLDDIISLDKIESYKIRATEVEKKVVKTIEKGKNKGTKKLETEYQLSDLLNRRVQYKVEKTPAKTPLEALQKTINEAGKIDLKVLESYLSELGQSVEEVIKTLSEEKLIFPDLRTRDSYILKPIFLSGNIKEKYAILESMAENNEKFDLPFSLPLDEYMSFLKENFPQDIEFGDIEVAFGANFVDLEIYKNFIRETFFNEPEKIKVTIEKFQSEYLIKGFKTLKIDDDTEEQIYTESYIGNEINDMGRNLMVYNDEGKLKFNLRDMLNNTINNKSMEVTHQEKIGENKYITIKEYVPTTQAYNNAETIRDAFSEYLFNNVEYRELVTKEYNNKVNVFTQNKLEYQNFLEMTDFNKNLKLRPHQDNAIFKGILNQSMLFDHQVGAGKTLVAIALVMEQKRMGLINKGLVLVPNHLTGQWANEFYRAYPNANILIGDKIDSKKKRKEFLYSARNGDFDAIIMKHSTFEKMGVSELFVKNLLESQLELAKKMLKRNQDDAPTKQNLTRKIKSIETKLEEKSKKNTYDGEISFEDLGVDCLIVDEAHAFKNLFIMTNQFNIRGLPLTESAKAMKMYCATNYMHENNKKVYFFTGTPVSNSISEFYTMQRYIQPKVLKSTGLEFFDDWQKAFSRVVLSEELDSSGVNYTMVNRLSKFVNTPELLSLHKQNTDIVTNEDIEKTNEGKRIVPKIRGGKAENIVVPRSDDVARFIGIEDDFGNYNEGSIIDRMDRRSEDPKRNNVLVCTSEARKAALDYRLIDPQASDFQDSKINIMVQKVKQHYFDERYPLNTQLIFCDLGVSKINSQKVDVNTNTIVELESIEDIAKRKNLELYTETDEEGNQQQYYVEFAKSGKRGKAKEGDERKILKKYTYQDLMEEQSSFDVYSEIKKKLAKHTEGLEIKDRFGRVIENNSINPEEIVFIGDANTDTQKQALFDKVNNGINRILIGSTAKMGAGTNVQERVVAMHELDCPWRPADLQQRLGRVVRQGNLFFAENPETFEIAHYRYATEQTYDARMFQINEMKYAPLIQMKKSEFLKEQRVFDGIDEEMANIADMKAVATGNPFILLKNQIENKIRLEENYEKSFRQRITNNESQYVFNKNVLNMLDSKIKVMEAISTNDTFLSEFKKDNYSVEVLPNFGSFKTTKKANGKDSASINEFNKTREPINTELKRLERLPENYIRSGEEGIIRLMQIGGEELSLKTEIIGQNITFRGFFQKGNDIFYPDNMVFRKQNINSLENVLSVNGILERMKNVAEKLPDIIKLDKESRKQKEKNFLENQKFLKDMDKLDENGNIKTRNVDVFQHYDRKILKNVLKKDLSNMIFLMRLRSWARKEKKIKIEIDNPLIQDALPQFSLFYDKKDAFIGKEEAKIKEKELLERIPNFFNRANPLENSSRNDDSEQSMSDDFESLSAKLVSSVDDNAQEFNHIVEAEISTIDNEFQEPKEVAVEDEKQIESNAPISAPIETENGEAEQDGDSSKPLSERYEVYSPALLKEKEVFAIKPKEKIAELKYAMIEKYFLNRPIDLHDMFFVNRFADKGDKIDENAIYFIDYNQKEFIKPLSESEKIQFYKEILNKEIAEEYYTMQKAVEEGRAHSRARVDNLSDLEIKSLLKIVDYSKKRLTEWEKWERERQKEIDSLPYSNYKISTFLQKYPTYAYFSKDSREDFSITQKNEHSAGKYDKGLGYYEYSRVAEDVLFSLKDSIDPNKIIFTNDLNDWKKSSYVKQFKKGYTALLIVAEGQKTKHKTFKSLDESSQMEFLTNLFDKETAKNLINYINFMKKDFDRYNYAEVQKRDEQMDKLRKELERDAEALFINKYGENTEKRYRISIQKTANEFFDDFVSYDSELALELVENRRRLIRRLAEFLEAEEKGIAGYSRTEGAKDVDSVLDYSFNKSNEPKFEKAFEEVYDIKPNKEFGRNFKEFFGDVENAIRFLAFYQQGQVIKAYTDKDLGDLNLCWGKAEKLTLDLNNAEKGYGLAEVFSRYRTFTTEQMVEKIVDILKNGTIEQKQDLYNNFKMVATNIDKESKESPKIEPIIADSDTKAESKQQDKEFYGKREEDKDFQKMQNMVIDGLKSTSEPKTEDNKEDKPAENIKVITNDRETAMENLDKLNEAVLVASIEFSDFTGKTTMKEKIMALNENQKNIKETKRSRDILGVIKK